jgi:hypothetical protein
MVAGSECRWAPSQRNSCAVVLVPCAADVDSVSFLFCSVCCFLFIIVVVFFSCWWSLLTIPSRSFLRSTDSGVKTDAERAKVLEFLRICYNAEDMQQFREHSEALRQWCNKNGHKKACLSSAICSLLFFFPALLSTHRCVQVYKKFEKEYEPEDRAYMWVHGLTQSRLSGGLHQLLPVRTNNLLERVWRVLKYERVKCFCLRLFFPQATGRHVFFFFFFFFFF